ncbi:MAG TPA: hypothetical protein V6C81_06965 [Planktothrix sp.]|jgi:hypothetical protein
MRKLRNRYLISRYLRGLPNFLQSREEWEFDDSTSDLAEHAEFLSMIVGQNDLNEVVGVYMNAAPELDCLVFTCTGVHAVRLNKSRFIPYLQMQSISQPQDGDCDLDVCLESGDYVSLRCSGQSEDLVDIEYLYKCLATLIEQKRHYTMEFDDIDDDSSLCKLMRECLDRDECEDIEAYYQTDFRDWAAKLNIDQKLLDDPRVWKLMALAALRPQYPRLKRTEHTGVELA